MEMTQTTTYSHDPRRTATLNGLAAVGFITLIVLGILLAIYSARFVPSAVSRIGSAAVYLSQVFVPNKSDLTVVPQVPFDTAGVASTSVVASSSTTTAPSAPITTYPASSAGPKTTTTYPAGGASNAPLYGQADLTVAITGVGYLTSNNTDSYVSGVIVPANDNAAVKFTVTNVGTNVSGPWNFNAMLPTNSTFTFTSNPQLSLRPGERIDFTLGFDRAQSGIRTITVTVDPSNQVSESSEANNSASHSITIQ